MKVQGSRPRWLLWPPSADLWGHDQGRSVCDVLTSGEGTEVDVDRSHQSLRSELHETPANKEGLTSTITASSPGTKPKQLLPLNDFLTVDVVKVPALLLQALT